MPTRYQTEPELRERLHGIFGYTAVGRAGALKMPELLAKLGPRWSERAVRMAVAELVVLDRIPIAGDSRAGYYRCVTREERLAQMAELVGRIRALAKRVRTFAEVTEADLGGQQTLDFSVTPEEWRDGQRLAEMVLLAVGDGDADPSASSGQA